MAKSTFLKTKKNFYILGVGGVSMSAIATYLLDLGHTVYGYDKAKSEKINSLTNKGLVYKKISPNDLSGFIVIYSSAVENTAYFNELKNNGVALVKRSVFLGLIQKNFKINIAISGCHGKTTTTAMLAHVLKSANMHPTAFIGGEDNEFSNYLKGKNKVCIMEACEYKKNFLDLSPNVVVVTNIDADHLDSYDGVDDLRNTFKTFCEGRIAVINQTDDNSKHLLSNKSITFGLNKGDYLVNDAMILPDGITFTVIEKGRKKATVKLNLKGEYNVQNALAVIATARRLGVGWKRIKRGLLSFTGVKRRNEKIGEINKMIAFCDYAHHPNEIKSLFSTLDLEKTLVVFQPHTFSRTAYLMDDFVDVLKRAKSLIIYKTYPAREKYLKKGSAKSLYLRLIPECENKVYYAPDMKSLKEQIESFKDKEKVVFVGAGDIYQLANKIKDKM